LRPQRQQQQQRRPNEVSRGARIINTTSFLGRVSPFSLSAYSASKFALEALSHSLRAEMRAQGVHVAVLQPGTTRTKLGGHMSRGMDACWTAATEQDRRRLGPTYLRAMERSAWMLDLFGRDVSSILPEVEHAVCARWPKSRYVCGWDSFLFGQVLPLLPAWLCDFGCLIVLGWPRPAGDDDTAAAGDSSAASSEPVSNEEKEE